MDDSASGEFLENVTLNELTIGRMASLTRTLTKEDILLFARVSGDVNPAHLDEDYARSNIFHGVIGHGMWVGGLISTVLGTILPGPGTIYLAQDLKFKAPVRLDDRVTVDVTVKQRRDDKPIVVFDCKCTNQKGEVVVEGTATVLAPTEKVRRPRPDLPEVEVRTHDRYYAIMQAHKNLPPVATAVVYPVKPHLIETVNTALRESLMVPLMIGPKAEIEAAAAQAGIDIKDWALMDVGDKANAADAAAWLAAQGKVEAIMKGDLHSETVMRAILRTSARLHTARRFSHVYVLDLPGYHKPLFVSDAIVNGEPNLDTKVDICQNAIDLWHILFGDKIKPKVAILAPIERTMSKLPSTVDAAALCTMAARGQITGAIVDGPLALDNALSKQVAEENGITSEVCGDADILIAPNMDSANILARRLYFLGHSDAAGVILGARVPIIVPRPTDNLRTCLFSCALAVILADVRRKEVSPKFLSGDVL
ncbi:MAG: bifunctional enoyl-CoA hydratase/phosphate acetyltransferase [Bdellovibrionales bacterium]